MSVADQMTYTSTVRLSRELQVGKAAEHIVCADLILQGHCAFLSDQGLPYDVVVDAGGLLHRVQVRASLRARTTQGRSEVYTFGTRRAKGSGRACKVGESDWYALVALDRRLVAYLPARSMVGRDGVSVVQCIQLRSAASDGKHNGRPTGATRAMRRFEDFAVFNMEAIA